MQSVEGRIGEVCGVVERETESVKREDDGAVGGAVVKGEAKNIMCIYIYASVLGAIASA